jgi:hypothetical protein
MPSHPATRPARLRFAHSGVFSPSHPPCPAPIYPPPALRDPAGRYFEPISSWDAFPAWVTMRLAPVIWTELAYVLPGGLAWHEAHHPRLEQGDSDHPRPPPAGKLANPLPIPGSLSSANGRACPHREPTFRPATYMPHPRSTVQGVGLRLSEQFYPCCLSGLAGDHVVVIAFLLI